MTGESIRRLLADAGQPDYVPFIYAQDPFGNDVRDAVSGAFRPYIEGQRSREDAAAELVRLMAP